MQVHGAVLNNMLKGISDPKLRETYGAIIAGKMPYEVYCLNPQINPNTEKPFHSPKCKIGYIDSSGKCVDEQIVRKNGQIVAGIESSRDRFDGRKGFKCYCGNSSIRSDEESAVIGTEQDVPIFARPPSRQELNDIFGQLQKSGKTALQFVKGWVEYDGFGLMEIAQ